MELEVVSLPDGVKDPDELIQKDPALWQTAIDQSQPAVDWVIARYAEMENLKSAEGKRRFSTIALRIVRGLKDPVEQEHYLSVISEKTGASITALKAKLSNEKVAEHQLKKAKIEKEKPTPIQDETEDMLAGLAAKASSTGREEVILSQKDRARYGKQVVTQANERLGDGHLTLSVQTRPIRGGLILSDGDVEVNCTFETLVRLLRGEMDRTVVEVLFG